MSCEGVPQKLPIHSITEEARDSISPGSGGGGTKQDIGQYIKDGSKSSSHSTKFLDK